jgi:hypothetical protein
MEDPRDVMTLPNVIITGATEQRDFFAWASTYLQTLRPLSAYMRISDFETAQHALNMQGSPTLHRLENACVGLILGETATHLGGQRDLKQVPARACASTYSFVMARALAMGLMRSNIDPIATGWFEARELTHQSKLSLSKSLLGFPWYVLLGLEDGTWQSSPPAAELPRPVLEACLDLYLKGEVNNRQWHSLQAEVPGISVFADMMRGPREDRVVAFEQVVHQMRGRTFENPITLSFVLGYLASQVAPGTLDHIHLLSPYMNDFPGVLLWYGLCAGLYRRSNVASYAGGLGRRAIREVLRSEAFMDRPICDIALSELRLIGNRGVLDFRTSSNNHIDVEIAPCVTSTLRWPPRSESQDQIFQPGISRDEIKYLDLELTEVIDHLQDISSGLRRLKDVDGKTNKPERKQRRR